MSNKDYTKYSKEPQVTPKPVEAVPDQPVVETVVDPQVTEQAPEVQVEPEVTVSAAPETPATKTGFVYGCSKLNVRSEPKSDASIVCVIEQKSEVEIDMAQSTDDFYKVCLASGIEGFCVKSYIIEK